MAKQKSLEDLIKRREALEAEQRQLDEQIQQQSSNELVEVLNRALAMVGQLQDVGLSKEAKAAIRKLANAAGVSGVQSKASGVSREEKQKHKQSVVDQFLSSVESTFKIPELADAAAKAGLQFTGSAEQFFRSQLKDKATKTSKKDGTAVVWKKKP